MSTISLLYPFGFQLFGTLPSVSDDRPKTFPIQDAMNLFWSMCEANVDMSLTTSAGSLDVTLSGTRRDISNNIIPSTSSLTLIDGISRNYTSDGFSASLFAPSVFVPGVSPIGADVTYGDVRFRTSGEFYFTPTDAQPVLTLSGAITSASTGRLYSWSIQSLLTLDQIFGDYLRIDGTLIPCYIAWSGAGADPAISGLIDITTTQTFIWP